MVEINLLPWRSELQQHKNKMIKVSIIIFIAVIMVFCAVLQVRNLFFQEIKKPIQSPVHLPLLKYHYMGYVQQNKEFLALIQLPNGQTMDVKTGSALGENNGRVIKVNEKEIILKVADQTIKVLYAQ